MSDVVQELRIRAPKLHGSADQPRNWSSQWEVLDFLAAHMQPSMRSLETGCGYSTVVFAASGADHTAVTPSVDEPARVRALCEKIGIDHSQVTFEIGPSCEVLPKGGSPLDLVYIDGAHGFPHPSIDWMYTEGRLKIGGLMLLDDIRIPSCRIVHDFLKREANWKLDRWIGDTAIYAKVSESPDNSQWLLQGYNTDFPDYSFMPIWKRGKLQGRRWTGFVLRKLGLAAPVKKLLRRQ